MSNIVQQMEQFIEDTARSPDNPFGEDAWDYHIQAVREYAILLANKLDADVEVVELAALGHDYGSIAKKGWFEDHEIHGAREIGKFLDDRMYDYQKTKNVMHCIEAHRSSKQIPRETPEAEIVANADAMAHANSMYQLQWAIYINMDKKLEEGREYLLKKLERSWNKLTLIRRCQNSS
jgi:uncharacterized protein